MNPATVSAVFQDSCFSMAICTVLLSECHAWFLCSCFYSYAHVYVIMKWQSRILFMEPYHWKYKHNSSCPCIPLLHILRGKIRWLIDGDVQIVNRVFKQNSWSLLLYCIDVYSSVLFVLLLMFYFIFMNTLLNSCSLFTKYLSATSEFCTFGIFVFADIQFYARCIFVCMI